MITQNGNAIRAELRVLHVVIWIGVLIRVVAAVRHSDEKIPV